MFDGLRRQIIREAEATLDKALARARIEAVQALRRAVLSLIAVVLALFALAFASFAAFVFLRGEIGSLWAACAIAGLLFALSLICLGFAAVTGRKPSNDAGEAKGAADPSPLGDAAASEPVAPITSPPESPPPAAPVPAARTASSPSMADHTPHDETQGEARETLHAVMAAVSDEVTDDTARAILREGSRHVGALKGWQLGLAAAATGFLYAQNTPRRRRR